VPGANTVITIILDLINRLSASTAPFPPAKHQLPNPAQIPNRCYLILSFPTIISIPIITVIIIATALPCRPFPLGIHIQPLLIRLKPEQIRPVMNLRRIRPQNLHIPINLGHQRIRTFLRVIRDYVRPDGKDYLLSLSDVRDLLWLGGHTLGFFYLEVDAVQELVLEVGL